MELRSGSQKSAEPHTPKPRAPLRSSGQGIMDGDEPSREEGETSPIPSSPMPESTSVTEPISSPQVPVAPTPESGTVDSSAEAVGSEEASPVPVADAVEPPQSLMTDQSTDGEQPAPVAAAPSDEAPHQVPADSANILTCVLSLMHLVSKAAQQQAEQAQEGAAGNDLPMAVEAQAACPEGSEGSTAEAKEGEDADVAASVTSATGMECCEAGEGEGAQGAEPMAVEEEKDGQAPGKPEEVAVNDGEAGEQKGDEDMMEVATSAEGEAGAVLEVEQAVQEAQDGQAEAVLAVEAEGGLARQLAQERAEKERLRSALVECSAMGRREASSLRAFQESLKSWALQRMNECTADVARLGCRLIVGWEAEQTRITTLESLLRKETQRRRKLFNDLQAMRGNIRVFCRVRPPKPSTAGALPPAVTQSSCSEVSLRSSPGATPKTFELDNVFGPTSTQGEVWSEVEGLVTSVMDGYQACILAYGQTGSGKTYTMEGSEEDPGINTRALQQLFALKETKEASALVEVKVEVSMVEIYNESVRDLLADPSATKAQGTQSNTLDIRQGEQGVYVQGARILPVSSLDDVKSILRSGQRMRATCSTRANASSSRSHSLLLVSIKTTDHATHLHTSGRLILVDLAGSERLSKTGAEGQALKEAQNINRSLSALGDVIAALRNKQEFKGSGKGAENQHVPYRNSKLTFLLQDALGADNKALMIVQVSPDADDAGESLCSLNFAARVNGVQLGATRHLKGDNRFFRDALSRLRSEAKDLEAKNKDAAATIAALNKDLAKAREEADSRGKEGSATVSTLQAQLAHAKAAEQTANDKCEVLLERIEQLRRDMATEKSAQAVRDVASEEERAAAMAAAQRQAAALQQDKDRLQQAIAAKDQELAAMQRTLASLSSLSTAPPMPPTATPLHKARAPPAETIAQALSPPAAGVTDTGAADASFLMQSAQKQLRAALGSRGESQRSAAVRAPPPPCAIYRDDDEDDTDDMSGLGEEEATHARPRSAYVGTPRKPSAPSLEGDREPRHVKRPLPSQDAENMPPTDVNRTYGPGHRVANDQQPAKRKKVTFMLPPPSPEGGMEVDEDDAPSGPGNGQPLQQHRALEPIAENVLMNLQHPGNGALGTDQVPSFEPASSHRVTPYKRRPSFLAPTAASSAPPVPPPAPPLSFRSGPSNALGTATRIQQAAPPTPSRLKKPARVLNAQAPSGPPSRMSLGGAKMPGRDGGRWR